MLPRSIRLLHLIAPQLSDVLLQNAQDSHSRKLLQLLLCLVVLQLAQSESEQTCNKLGLERFPALRISWLLVTGQEAATWIGWCVNHVRLSIVNHELGSVSQQLQISLGLSRLGMKALLTYSCMQMLSQAYLVTNTSRFQLLICTLLAMIFKRKCFALWPTRS